jgi:hypothetical protein
VSESSVSVSSDELSAADGGEKRQCEERKEHGHL